MGVVEDRFMSMKLHYKEIPSNPRVPGEQESTIYKHHYKVTIIYNHKRVSFYYTKEGAGFAGTILKPTIAEVLRDLALVCHSIEQTGSFRTWCAQKGFNADDSRIIGMYEKICADRRRFISFIGDSMYDYLIRRMSSVYELLSGNVIPA